MNGRTIGGVLLMALLWSSGSALAGPWEDGMAAYNRGDYVPAVQTFRALAGQGNVRAQSVLGAMYRRGLGVKRSSAHAYLWLTRAAVRGDARAKRELRQVSQSMTADELSQARAIMQACEASDYRNCPY